MRPDVETLIAGFTAALDRGLELADRWADAAFAARDGAWVKLVLRSRAGRCAVLTRRGELCRRPAREGDVCRFHAGLITGVKAT
jgi:hypothetical protein